MQPTQEHHDLKPFEAKLDSAGRVLLPKAVRNMLNVKRGGTVMITPSKGSVTIASREEQLDQAIKRAQALFRAVAPPDVCLSEELIQERREEVARGE